MTGTILLAVFLSSLLGTLYYRSFARRRGIVAVQNARTLHDKAVPRGGGIVFAGVCSVAILAIWLAGGLPAWQMLAFGVGGSCAALIGFVDDVHDVRPMHKLLAQSGLAVWLFATYYGPLYGGFLRDAGWLLTGFMILVLLFVPLWLINLYNFIDGIDGMASGGSVFICVAALSVLTVTGGNESLMLIFALLAAASLGFLYLNLPPATIFMGDAGSIFLGYSFAALLLASIMAGQISPWTWIAIMSYYIGDTTTTTVSRMFLVKRWYGVHRSHAYQNLARIHRSHAKVTYGVALYNFLWALPLAVWSALYPASASLAAVAAIAPVVIWTLRFGPRLSSA